MALSILANVLAPSVVTRRVSRIFTPGNPLTYHFGMQIGGPNVDQIVGRAYSWDYFDHVRSIALGRSPGTGPAKVAANPVGHQTNTFPRAYQSLVLDYEKLNNIRAIGQNAGVRDRMGMAYLDAQFVEQKSQHDNWREFQLAALLTQGQCSWQFVGDDWIPVLSLGSNPGFTLNWQIPSGNLGIVSPFAPNLNMTGAGNIITAPWSNNTTDIGAQLDNISIGFQQLTGAPLRLAICDSLVWNMLISNSILQAQSGSVNPVFETYAQTQPLKGKDGNDLGVMEGRLKARPWIRWLITDQFLLVNGSLVKPYPGNRVTFMVEPNQGVKWLQMQEGSEPVKENPMAPAVDRQGFFSWLREWDEPCSVSLCTIQNAVVELTIPAAVAIGTVA
jgi:hypothetical protein